MRARSRALKGAGVLLLVVVVLAAGWVAFALSRAVPAPTMSLSATTVAFPPSSHSLSLPHGVDSAIAVGGVGTVASSNANLVTPLASVTKIMSTLVILHDHPLTVGASGPAITITPADVATYNTERVQQDSVVPVRDGEQLTEFQALEAILIPSGDNIVQLLANWDSGSTAAFVAKMNAMARALGLHHTHYAGPSGVNPGSVSSPADQLRLAQIAMRNPTFASIVAMPQATLPVAGVVYNVNADLGTDGIIGIKTGWLPQGGACFVFAAKAHVARAKVTIFGALEGQQGGSPLPTALSLAEHLVKATGSVLQMEHVPAGLKVATLSSAAGASVALTTTSPLSLLGWGGARARLKVRVSSHLSLPLKAGEDVGEVTLTFGAERRRTALQTAGTLPVPSLRWRLGHF